MDFWGPFWWVGRFCSGILVLLKNCLLKRSKKSLCLPSVSVALWVQKSTGPARLVLLHYRFWGRHDVGGKQKHGPFEDANVCQKLQIKNDGKTRNTESTLRYIGNRYWASRKGMVYSFATQIITWRIRHKKLYEFHDMVDMLRKSCSAPSPQHAEGRLPGHSQFIFVSTPGYRSFENCLQKTCKYLEPQSYWRLCDPDIKGNYSTDRPERIWSVVVSVSTHKKSERLCFLPVFYHLHVKNSVACRYLYR